MDTTIVINATSMVSGDPTGFQPGVWEEKER
jgi:hypothetical protein